ncbi:MAG: SipW-dependent-type signal peptide-containing protein [Roseburia sp.]|nr:SipW-dependent-type signal peptide-containing protein [Roseburia sp.]
MKATKKIVGAACALVAAVALSAGSTFAWFTSNSNVTVGQIEATVVTMGGDLQIAIKSQTLASGATEYTEGDLGSYSYKVENPFATSPVLTAVTSVDGKAFTGRAASGATETPSAVVNTTATSGGYVKFTISLRSTTNMTVYLDTASKVASEPITGKPQTSIAAWKDIKKDDYGTNAVEVNSGDSISASAKNAVRVAFMVEGDEEAPDAKSQGKIWAPNEESDNGGLGVADGYSKGNLASDYEVNASGESSRAYTNVTTTNYTDNKLVPVTPVTAGTGGATTDYSTATSSVICTLEANTPKEVVICLWIEGRDGDCFNSIFTQSVKLDLAFHGEDIVDNTTSD